jgi:hypothetical protein
MSRVPSKRTGLRFQPRGYSPPSRHAPVAPRVATEFGEPVCSRQMPALLPKDKLIVHEPLIPGAVWCGGSRRRAAPDWTILAEAAFMFLGMALLGSILVGLLGICVHGPEVSDTTHFFLNILLVGLHVITFIMWCGISYFRALWEIRKRCFLLMTTCYVVLLTLFCSV